MTSREAFFALFRGEAPEFVPADGPYDMIYSPAEHYRGSHEAGAQGKDWFGVSWTYTAPFLATPTPGVYRLEEIGDWESEQVVPSAQFIDSFDWKAYCSGFTSHWDRDERLSVCMVSSGFFERMHHLLGFEEALVSFYTDPDAVHRFLDALLEFKKHTIHKIWEHAKPDVILFMDDYGSAQNLFFSKEMWDEFFRPRLTEIVRYVHELGMFFEMHSCGYITPLAEDMMAMGIDALQPLQAVNDLKFIKDRLGGKVLLHGGITASDMTTMEVSREKIRACIELMSSGGGYVPQCSECLGKEDAIRRLFVEEFAKIGIVCK